MDEKIIKIENIKALMESNISAYRIEKDTGVDRMTVTRIRNKGSKLERMGLETGLKLSQYWDQVKGEEKMIVKYEGNFESGDGYIVNFWHLEDEEMMEIYELLAESDHPEVKQFIEDCCSDEPFDIAFEFIGQNYTDNSESYRFYNETLSRDDIRVDVDRTYIGKVGDVEVHVEVEGTATGLYKEAEAARLLEEQVKDSLTDEVLKEFYENLGEESDEFYFADKNDWGLERQSPGNQYTPVKWREDLSLTTWGDSLEVFGLIDENENVAPVEEAIKLNFLKFIKNKILLNQD